MVDDLLSGRVTSFRREQGFGVITLDDGRDVKFDASNCIMVPEEGAAVRLRIGPARWGGGIKALHVEPRGSSTLFVPKPPPTLDEQIAALQREHLVGALSEHAMARLSAEVFGGMIDDASLLDVLDAFYAADAAQARHDGYLGFAQPPAAEDLIAAVAAVVPGVALPPSSDAADAADIASRINDALAAAGEPRRLYPLETGGAGRAYFLLAPDRARRLAKTLPFG